MITVHLSEVGVRRFEGQDAKVAAHTWAESCLKQRDGGFAVRPDDMDTKLWESIQGEAGEAVYAALQARRRATTNELCAASGFARPTVSRILHAYACYGHVRDLGQANGRAPKMWEMVEPAEAGDSNKGEQQ